MLDRLIPASIDLQIEPAAKLNRVKADPGQIEQVILNLAVNARDAMPDGGRLTIKTRNAELKQTVAGSHAPIPPGQYVVLEVSDTGLGMRHEIQARMFEPFFTTKKPGQGTGLGLAIVYGVVKQTGGWITSRSEPGKGTSFDLYFPQVHAATREAVTESAARKVSASAISGTETILLVEDQEGIRELAREYLRQKGYTVLDAADGNEGLRVAAEYKNPIHLLLTDVVMPNVGGQELAKRLAQERGQIKVLFMSGYPDHATWDADLPDDTAAVLQKPFTLESLARKIRALLDE
jgi:two-component system cell cycle sensor histidine kinase/response regulator CckA